MQFGRRKNPWAHMQERAWDVFLVQTDGEERLCSGLTSAELGALLDWCSYTKPMGRSVKIVARSTSGGDSTFCLRVTGTEPGEKTI